MFLPPEEVSARPASIAAKGRPYAPPIFPASVYQCETMEQAQALLDGTSEGYVYQRDGHPNADMLAEKCRQLHAAKWAVITASGMSALAAAVLTHLAHGQHLIASRHLYGQSLCLLAEQLPRFGIEVSVVDTNDLAATRNAVGEHTRMIVVETLSNPCLHVADLPELAQLAQTAGARLLVDNTFASPLVCQPLQLGADLVLESLSKIMNGHSDVMLGLLCGRHDQIRDVQRVLSVWGLGSAPFDCWLAQRGMGSLHLRLARACEQASALAAFLADHPRVVEVRYPGLASHPQHALARQQLAAAGWMITFDLLGGQAAVAEMIRSGVPFCPSLGELTTTMSHPASTSHRGLTALDRAQLGISDGTVRLSVGTESLEFQLQLLERGLGGR